MDLWRIFARMETDDGNCNGGLTSHNGGETSLETDTRPSNSGGPISRQSCYYASFSPPHGNIRVDGWQGRRGWKKAFCSSVCEMLFCSTRSRVSSGARGCWSLRGFFFSIALLLWAANSSIFIAKINTLTKHKQGHEVCPTLHHLAVIIWPVFQMVFNCLTTFIFGNTAHTFHSGHVW